MDSVVLTLILFMAGVPLFLFVCLLMADKAAKRFEKYQERKKQ